MKKALFAIGVGISISGAAVLACVSDGSNNVVVASDAEADGTTNAVDTGGGGGGPDGNGGTDTGVALDAGSDAPRCDPTKVFSTPIPLPNVNFGIDAGADAEAVDESVTLTPDELSLFLVSSRADIINGGRELYVSTRASRDVEFTVPSKLSTADALNGVLHPSITADQLRVVYATGTPEIDVTDRPSATSPFTAGTIINVSGTNNGDGTPAISPDGKTLYWSSVRTPTPTALRLFQATAYPDAGGFGNVLPLSELDGIGTIDAFPAVTPDALAIYFTSDRADASAGAFDIWAATRTSPVAVFGTPKEVTEVNSPGNDLAMWISPDQCVLYLASNRIDGKHLHIYRATRGK